MEKFMRVDLTPPGLDPPENSKAGRAAHPEAVATGPGSTSTPSTPSTTSTVDQTRFSYDRTRVHSLQAQVLAQPEIRQAKVRSLQQAIGSGQYSVPASHVADALVGDLGAVQGLAS